MCSFGIMYRLGNSATTYLFSSRGHMFENVSKKCVIGANVSRVTKAAHIALNTVKGHLTPKYFFCLNKSLHQFEMHLVFLN